MKKILILLPSKASTKRFSEFFYKNIRIDKEVYIYFYYRVITKDDNAFFERINNYTNQKNNVKYIRFLVNNITNENFLSQYDIFSKLFKNFYSTTKNEKLYKLFKNNLIEYVITNIYMRYYEILTDTIVTNLVKEIMTWFYFLVEKIETIQPNYIIIDRITDGIQRIIYSLAKYYKIPIISYEAMFVPKFVDNAKISTYDPAGIHFFGHEDKSILSFNLQKKYKNIFKIKKEDIQNTEKELINITDNKKTKFNGFNTQSLNIIKTQKIVSVIGQVPYDANILFSSKIYENTWNMFSDILLSFQQNELNNITFLYKPHPLYLKSNYFVERHAYEKNLLNNNKWYADLQQKGIQYNKSNIKIIGKEINIYDIFDISDYFFVFTSTVGIEMLIYKYIKNKNTKIFCSRTATYWDFCDSYFVTKINNVWIKNNLNKTTNKTYNEFLKYITIIYNYAQPHNEQIINNLFKVSNFFKDKISLPLGSVHERFKTNEIKNYFITTFNKLVKKDEI